MTEVAQRGAGDAGGPELSPELVARFASMAAAIPEDDGSGSDRILEQLLSATTLDDLNAPWDVTKAKSLAGKLMRIDALKRRPSTFAGGLGIFLVADYTDTKTGEKSVFTTSSVNVVAQLAQAFFIGGLPIYAELVISDRPTADGYYPHHLRMIGQGAGG